MENKDTEIKELAQKKARNISLITFGVFCAIIMNAKLYFGIIPLLIISFILDKVIYNYYYNDLIKKHNKGENL